MNKTDFRLARLIDDFNAYQAKKKAGEEGNLSRVYWRVDRFREVGGQFNEIPANIRNALFL